MDLKSLQNSQDLIRDNKNLQTKDILGDVPFYNPYEIETYINLEYSISGNLFTLEKYDKEKHLKALNRITTGLKAQKDYTIDPRLIPSGANNEFVTNVSYAFEMLDYNRGKLTIADANKARFSIPDYVVNKPGVSKPMKTEMLGFSVVHRPFSFQFADLRNVSNIYLTTNESNLVVMDKFLQIDFELPSQRLFGFGERLAGFQLQEGTWTMWAKRPENCSFDDGTGGKQAYGVHPFVMIQGFEKGDFFGIFFRNANAQSPLIKYNINGGSTLSYITTGGQLEVEFFIHGSPKMIIQQYLHSIGHPQLPPFWSLGWGQSSYSYTTQDKVQLMIDKYDVNGIPLEHIWLDIPYMERFQDFTVDKRTFPNIKGMADQLHNAQRHLVLILDPGLAAEDILNPYYIMAQEEDVLIKSSIHPDRFNGALVGKMFSGKTVYLDWYNPKAYKVWKAGLDALYEQTHFDGLWLDENENTLFCEGECPGEEDVSSDYIHSVVKRMLKEGQEVKLVKEDDESWFISYSDQDTSSTYFLPFIPGFTNQGNLDSSTLSLNATHPSIGETQYNLHNLNGLAETEHTYNYLTTDKDYEHNDNRPFILTRSTFASSGRYASHWLGDNWRDWSYLRQSIAGIMQMNMFGIPHTGADICGFYGQELDQELCARWIQLAQFYPLARMHYNQTYMGQEIEGTEPYNLQGQWKTVAKNSIYARYQYLRLMYTCLFEAQEDGNTCFDPLFYYYPTDEKTFDNIEQSIMIAGVLKVSPILEPGVTDYYTSYFPQGTWVSMRDFSEIVQGGQDVELRAHTTVNVHLKEGSLIPFQDNSQLDIKTTAQLLEKPIQIIANRDKNRVAKGTLLLDKGISRKELYTGHYEYYQFSVQANSFQKYLTKGNHATQNGYLEKLVLVNAEDLKDTDFACAYTFDPHRIDLKIAYDSVAKTLTITPDEPLGFSKFRSIHWGSEKNGDIAFCKNAAFRLNLKGDTLPDLSKNQVSFLLSSNHSSLPDLNMTLTVMDTNMVNIKWWVNELPQGWRQPFTIPEDLIATLPPRANQKLSNYVKIIDKDEEAQCFRIQVIKRDGTVLADISEFQLSQFFNFASQTLYTPTGDEFKGVMGLGERVMDKLFYDDGVYTMWNRDTATPFDLGVPPGWNVYGTHPFFMYKNSNTTWVGALSKVANAQDWIISNFPNLGEIYITQIGIGGIGDYTYIIDTDPNKITSAYLRLVGKPALVPQWALGWHQCRYGYETLDEVKQVVFNYAQNNLPLDVQWSDIDYMFNYRDFTFDHVKYKGLDDFVEELHKRNMRYVPIIDAGIAQRPAGNYPPFDEGVKSNAFIKINNGDLLTGQVWPKDAVYVDYFSINGTHWWQNELYYMWKSLPFDGLWLDMNEASDFCNGICYGDQQVEDPIKYKTNYVPGLRDLEDKQMSLDGQHENGLLEYDVHNLYGIMETEATRNFFYSLDKRSFIVSRSTFAGSGKFTQMWLGDNFSNVRYMAQSVHGIMMMNVFGIPFTGSDICGFIDNTNPELCARWYVVGAFQPFSRNHNTWGANSQEPYVFSKIYYEENMSYTDIMRMAMRTKLSLIRYYYTILHVMSDVGGGPVYRPLFFDYPNDENTYQNTQNQVLLGPALQISHLSDKLGVNETDFYFPPGTYCDIFKPNDKCFTTEGETKTLRTKAYDFYAHLKQGNVIAMQDAFKYNANTTADLQNQPIDLHILVEPNPFFKGQFAATGTYINDDGLKRDIAANNNRYSFQVSQFTQDGILKITIQVSTKYATNYTPVDGTYCYKINQNDFIQGLYFYNSQAYGQVNKFGVEFTFMSGWVATVGTAKYDTDTDRLVLQLDEQYCLPNIGFITLYKLE